MSESKELLKFNWEQWPGRNCFLFNGYCNLELRKIITGPLRDSFSVLVGHFFVFSHNLAFMLFVVPFYQANFTFAVGIVQILLFALVWPLMFITEFTDPGILLSNFLEQWIGGKIGEKPPDPNLSVEQQISDTSSTASTASIYTCVLYRL
eukprot:TRINITY_DN13748_c0_g2_i1.p1 TRINITY_DN13748_c0_g2~~TRINITY_DN13748_c0_g2_i1.p1  ORF type:complete len:150 (+),score=21.41 TRINITY_DN13748_c0_g2_i1:153-602(+)